MRIDWIFYMVSIQCVITAIFTLHLYRLEKAREKREEKRAKSIVLIARGLYASITLGEAIAKSVQHIDKECNGEMEEALAFAKASKREHRDFLFGLGADNLQV